MNYEITVKINKDLEFVDKVFTDREAAFKWMDGLKKFELIEGTMNSVGSKYAMEFEKNSKVEILTETIIEFSPPSRIVTLYEATGVKNECINLFEEKDGVTYYTMKTDFKFSFPLNIFLWIFKRKFIQETTQSLNKFKEYCESL